MKTNLLNTIASLSLLVFLLPACTPSSGDSSTKSAAMDHAEMETSKVDAPAIDIHTAVFSGNLEVVKQHVAAGTDLDAKNPMTGSTPLLTASTFDKRAIAQVLIEGGADLAVTNNDGATALHVAAFFCRVEIVQLLLDAEADKSIRNNYGATPLESISGPFAEVKPIYEMMQQQLSPFGLQLELAELEKTRPVIAIMLQ